MAHGPAKGLQAIALVTLLALSGCFSGGPDSEDAQAQSDESWQPGPPTPRPDYDFSTAIEAVHNHADPTLHSQHYGFELVGHLGLDARDQTTLPGNNMEVALAGDWAFLSNWGPHRGLSIVDVSDPTEPRHVSDFAPSSYEDPYRFGGGSYWDVSVFPDGDLVVLSAQAMAHTAPGGPAGSPDAQERAGGGIFLINVTDKEHPYEESYTPFEDDGALIPVGVHNARPFEVDGTWYVAATTANSATFVMEVVGEPGARSLSQVSVVRGVHDTTVQTHPVTGEVLLYGAAGGVYITDITDPANPQVISNVPNGPDLSAYHQVVPNNVLVQGRHYTVAATESAEGEPTPFTILDTTDPYEPIIVGQWILPVDVSQGAGQPYRFSGHNVHFKDGRLAIGHYHAGVWLLDVTSPEHAAEPFAIGFYQPHQASANVPRSLMGVDAPMVWVAIQHDDGLIWASDVNSGLYALRFTGPASPYADAPEKWDSNIR